MTVRTRFAPSPTGPLHLGHAYAALVANALAAQFDGEFLLRIEDIDQSRARRSWERQIEDDLTWLGLRWPRPVLRQSERIEVYQEYLASLWKIGILYPCTCRRRDIASALSSPQEGAPSHGPDGLIYPGTCRHRYDRGGDMPNDVALRLDMEAALRYLEKSTIEFQEYSNLRDDIKVLWTAQELMRGVGDVVLSRKDMGTSYHLAVVIDDHHQDITLVSRGVDLADATCIHVLLQQLMEFSSPKYCHHRLIRDDKGKRLAKRDDARALATFRADGLTPQDIRQLIGFKPSETLIQSHYLPE